MPSSCRLVVLVLLLGASTGCSEPQRPLRVGLVVWPPYEIPLLARSLGLLDAAQVELVEFSANVEALRAYRNRVIDSVALPTGYAVELLAHSTGERVVLVIDLSNGADAVVAMDPIKDVRELKGRRVGIESGSLGRWVLARALQAAGLTFADVTLVSVDASGHEASFHSRAIDAVVTHEPIRSRLLAAGAKDIFNSSRMPGEIVDVLLATESTIAQRRAALRHLAGAWFDGVEYLRRHPEDAAQRVAPREGLAPDAYLLALAGTEVLGRRENAEWLDGPAPRLDAHLRTLAEAMSRVGLISGPLSIGHRVSTAEFVQ